MIRAESYEKKTVLYAALWSGTVVEMAAAQDAAIDALAFRQEDRAPRNHAGQTAIWRHLVRLLASLATTLPEPDRWRVLVAYRLLRLDRCIDAILLSDRAIFVIAFSPGATRFTQAARTEVEDHALDLQDFHAGSNRHPVIPVLVAPDAPATYPLPALFLHGVTPVMDAGADQLGPLLAEIDARIGPPARALDAASWEAAAYRPVPTIVDAATMLFNRHGVADIAQAHADIGSLGRTTAAIRTAVAEAQEGGHHIVVFVTGIPGAGKTLCGLNIVFAAQTGAAFLTGNLPLVHVLREALARDAASSGRSLRMARQHTESAIQPLLGFLRDNVARTAPPHENIIVFDEAQRAWDADFGRRRFGLDDSEAALFLDIMRRHAGHAVIVALVGQGQEINTGEAGIAEWGRALACRPEWQIRAAPGVLTATDPRQRLFGEPRPNLRTDPALHLDVQIRSIRSAQGSIWVDAVLTGDAAAARHIADAAGGMPFFLTRSLKTMRTTLRRSTRGHRRAGLVCSTGARRLRADGIWPDFPHLDDKAVADFFLNRWPDVRASDALEMPATQFACQGLELDLVGLCWGGDLVRSPVQTAWTARAFAGTRWTTPRDERRIAYRINTYRVLLTRARYETIIWVPEGDPLDATRDPATFDAVADFLRACGATDVEARPGPLRANIPRQAALL